MYGNVGFAIEHGSFQLLDEQALAANLGQWRVQQLVTTADHGYQGHLQTGMGLFQAGLDVLGLPQGQSALTGGDTDFTD